MSETALVPARKQSLMELVTTVKQLAELVASAATQEELDVIAAQLEGIDIPAKVDGIGFWKKEKEAHILYLKDAAADIQAQVHAEQAKLNQLLSWTHYALKASGAPELKGSVYTIGTRAEEPKLRIDESLVPAGCLTVTVQMSAHVWSSLCAANELLKSVARVKSTVPDAATIRANLELNQSVPGAQLLPAEDILVVRRNARKPRNKEVPHETELLTTTA